MDQDEKEVTIRALYPQLNADQLLEAKENMNRYIDFCIRMFERIERDPVARAKFEAELEKRTK